MIKSHERCYVRLERVQWSYIISGSGERMLYLHIDLEKVPFDTTIHRVLLKIVWQPAEEPSQHLQHYNR